MGKFKVFVLTLFLLLSSLQDASAQTVGKPAPPLQAKLLNGKSLSLASEAGKVVIINFWATWCAPCRTEMPTLNAYYNKHRNQGLVVLGISIDKKRNEAEVIKVMRQFNYPAALASDSNYNGYGRIWRVPLTFIVDRNGILRRDGWKGAPGIDRALLEHVVTPLLMK